MDFHHTIIGNFIAFSVALAGLSVCGFFFSLANIIPMLNIESCDVGENEYVLLWNVGVCTLFFFSMSIFIEKFGKIIICYCMKEGLLFVREHPYVMKVVQIVTLTSYFLAMCGLFGLFFVAGFMTQVSYKKFNCWSLVMPLIMIGITFIVMFTSIITVIIGYHICFRKVDLDEQWRP